MRSQIARKAASARRRVLVMANPLLRCPRSKFGTNDRNASVMVMPEAGIIVYLVRRAGSRTVRASLGRLEAPQDPAQFGLSRSIAAFRGFESVAITRSPFTRLLSAWHHVRVPLVEQGRIPAVAGSAFERCVQFLELGALHSDDHWAPQTSLIDIGRMRIVGRFERFGPSLEEICGQYYPGQELPTIEHPDIHRSSASGDFKDLPEELLERITRLYAADFRLLGYSTDPRSDDHVSRMT